ncbi:hypothetical protein DQQ10_18795 [Pseudochryseolinea flava]|uniref:Uncharacterized protein n=2 Tax=Pseudochryseolinea flava TaxID=2059302 RepID=A0A364XZ71_9BACT|nr:hypothetical protein DQQ10_18795 [Pseudochryseolinea flava]
MSVDEQITGADKLFDRFVPIYLQFKVSEGLKPISPPELPKFNVPLQRVRKLRFDNGLTGDPILYFKLREKAKTATEFQHNLLLQFHKPPRQFAFYVAPLTLDINEYNELLKVSLFERLIIADPFRVHPSDIYHRGFKESLGTIPFLRAHVSIPPFEKVTSAEHHYSFSKNGADIAWHRGVRQYGDFRLSTQIPAIFRTAYNNDRVAFSKQEFVETFNETDFGVNDSNENIDRKIYNFANFLYSNFRIRLFLLGINERSF